MLSRRSRPRPRSTPARRHRDGIPQWRRNDRSSRTSRDRGYGREAMHGTWRILDRVFGRAKKRSRHVIHRAKRRVASASNLTIAGYACIAQRSARQSKATRRTRHDGILYYLGSFWTLSLLTGPLATATLAPCCPMLPGSMPCRGTVVSRPRRAVSRRDRVPPANSRSGRRKGRKGRKALQNA